MFKYKIFIDKNILPHIKYCFEFWGNIYQTKLRLLVLLQKIVVRILEKVNRLKSIH